MICYKNLATAIFFTLLIAGLKDVHAVHSAPSLSILVLQSKNFDCFGALEQGYLYNQDVVSFSSLLSPQFISDLNKDGYQGLKQLPKDQFDLLVDQQNYIEILKYVWTESDLQFTIQALQPYAEQGHAILALELSRTLCHYIQEYKISDRLLIQQAFRWYVLGMIQVELDLACNNDPSTKSALHILQQNYSPASLIPHHQLQEIHPRHEMIRLIKELKLNSNYPSPKWILYHGHAISQGKDKMLPPANWDEARQQKYTELLRVFD